MRLLVIRPQPGADATAARIEASGNEALVMPLFEVQPVAWEVPPEHYDALMVTSANAVRQAGEGLGRLGNLPVYAVGSATSRALAKAGLDVTFTGDAGVETVLEHAKALGHCRLLWLAGEDHMNVSANAEVTIDIQIVYRSAALPVPENFADFVRSSDAVLLHSARAARHFAGICDAQGIDRTRVTVGALSPAIAADAGTGWREMAVEATPDDAALLSRLQSCFTNVSRDPYC